jgi:hypothetical protein
MQTLKNYSALCVILCFALSCAGRLTAEQQLLWANDVYLAQYYMWLDQVIDPSIVGEDRDKLKANPELITEDKIRPDLSEDQKDILNKKREVLIETKKYLEMAAAYRDRGEIAPADLQETITNLINSLVE